MTHTTMSDILGPRFATVSIDAARALSQLSLPTDAAILDVGTGSGNFAIYLALQGYQVLTGEPDTDQSRYARRDWAASAERAGVRDRIRFQSFDASTLPFENACFDAVFFFGVLHHIPEEQRPAVLREALRVSKPGGAVVFFEPRRAMLDQIWVEDPHHPLAANPSLYLPDAAVTEHRIEGDYMDIIFYSRERPVAISPAAS
ncbi:MAG: class I SAM-dependent methyltransferase [Bryobacteraceae bacterium]